MAIKAKKFIKCRFCNGSGEGVEYSGGGFTMDFTPSRSVAHTLVCSPCQGTGKVSLFVWQRAEKEARRMVYFRELNSLSKDIIKKIKVLNKVKASEEPRWVLQPIEAEITNSKRSVARLHQDSLSFGSIAEELKRLLLRKSSSHK